MKKIAIIPARSGSKGLPDKNILNLCGKPLIAWTIESAIKSECFNRIIVTTDSEEYGEISKKYGAEVFYRSKKTSADNTPMFDVINELFEKMDLVQYNYFALLQPTSPLRNEKHIKEAIKLFEDNYNNKNTLVSMVQAERSTFLTKTIDDDLSLKNFNEDYSQYSRQKYKEYQPNGAIFLSKIDYYLKKKHFFGKSAIAYIMDKKSSIDIDDELDFELAIAQIEKMNRLENRYQLVSNRIKNKKELHTRSIYNKDSIVLIGHCQIDELKIKKILNYNVINYGIGGISSFLFYDLILSKNLMKCNANKYFIMHGTNDLLYEKTNQEIYESIMRNINYIKDRNKKAVIYFIECLNVNGRVDRSNIKINSLNKYLKQKMKKEVKWIDTKSFNNKYGKLDAKYSNDGIHLNDNGYRKLKELIEETLEKE